MRRRYRGVTAQAIHYLSRPHRSVRTTPVTRDCAWTAADMADPGTWTDELGPADIEELSRALEAAEATGMPTESLTREHLPLPSLAPRITRWRRAIRDGRGFQVIRGVPVRDWDQALLERFFWGLGLHLGLPGAQNGAGELLGHVRDTRDYDDPEAVRGYRTPARLGFHCDFADVVGLLCLSRAESGGRSRLVSSAVVYNRLLQRRPDLVPLLYRPHPFDTRGDGGLRHVRLTPCRHDGERLRTMYHADYYRSVYRHPDVPAPDPRLIELFDLIDEIAADPDLVLEMDFLPGDIQLVCNHSILHGRTAYVDTAEHRRHLLRLWLSFEDPYRGRDRLAAWRERIRVIGALARAKLA